MRSMEWDLKGWIGTFGKPARAEKGRAGACHPGSPGSHCPLAPSIRWVLFVVVLGIGFGIRLPILLADTETILSHWGSDDLFYFTEIAGHLAAGDGLTFDGIHLTTGVQPLWLLLLAPFGCWFVGNGPLALSVVHWMVTGLTMVTALLFPWLSRQFLDDDWAVGWLASVIWVAHPRILGITFEGTEGALSSLAWLVALGVWKTDGRGTRPSIILGIVLGLGALTRVDFLLPAVILLVFRPGGLTVRPLYRMAVSASAFVLVAGMWPAVCWWTTGSPFPDSGAAKKLHGERLAEIQDDDAGGWQSWGYFDAAMQGPRYLMTTGGRVSRISLILVPLSLMGFGIFGRSRERRWSVFPRTMRLATGLWPVIVASGCLLALYPLVLRSMRSWYVAGPLLVMTILVASFVIDLAAQAPKGKGITTMTAVAVWLVACNFEAALFPRDSQTVPFIIAGEISKKYVRPGTQIGAFNAGILGAWAAPGITVINLDGVVNHSAVVALRDQDLAGYVERNNIQFIIDFEASLAFYDSIGGADLQPRLRRLETVPCGRRHILGIWQVDPNGGASSGGGLSRLPVPSDRGLE